MSKVSVIIPSRNEIFLTKTIKDVLEKSDGDIEVIANIDETWPEEIIEDKRVIYLHPDTPKGMRYGINACASVAKGEYLMKIDGHCMFEQGFDTVLKADMQDNWVVIPRRHSLDPINWDLDRNGKAGRDYHYLCYPDPNKGHDAGVHGVEWPERSRQRSNNPEYDIDDTPSFQGSAWFMKKTWFTDFLGGMHEEGYGDFSQEPQEVGFKTWFGGGEVKVNKKTWYAHLHKGKKFGRMYHMNETQRIQGHNYSAWYWMNDNTRIHNMQWFIEKFWPMPTWDQRWMDNWEKSFAEWQKEYKEKAFK